MARLPGSRIRNYDIEPSNNRYGPKAVEPHTPWQLMIEAARLKTKTPLRKVAEKSDIPAGTLFNWLRAKTGAPPRATYTANLNRRLAETLKIKPEDLAEAYNKSAFAPVDPDAFEESKAPSPAPAPAPMVREDLVTFRVDGLKRLLAMLRSTGRNSFTLAEIELSAAMIGGPAVSDPNVKPLDDPDQA
jgi:hypothetical protein